jgi:hypothetical protein
MKLELDNANGCSAGMTSPLVRMQAPSIRMTRERFAWLARRGDRSPVINNPPAIPDREVN